MLYRNKHVNQERERHGIQKIEDLVQKRGEGRLKTVSHAGAEDSELTLKQVRRFFYFYISIEMKN